MKNISISLVDSNTGEKRVEKVENLNYNTFLFSYPCNSPFDCTPYKVDLPNGIYKIECYGAGANFSAGGYTSGILKIIDHLTLYFYLGASESHIMKTTSTGVTFNGGGGNQIRYSSTGNGATDVRLNYSENWYDFPSLKSRIMVAGGAGGSEGVDANNMGCSTAGFGGGIQAGDGQTCNLSEGFYDQFGYGGSNTKGGDGGLKGKFGRAAAPEEEMNRNSGGGGYYGGGSSSDNGATGGGGSSFISGYDGCDAISVNSTENNITHTGQSIHYSGIYFTNPIMYRGNESFISPDRSGNETGHRSSGNIVLTWLGPFNLPTKINIIFSLISPYFAIFLYTRSE